MRKKNYYRYNEDTGIYERVTLTPRQRFVIVLRHLGLGVVLGMAFFLIVYYWIDFPREKQLKLENIELKAQYSALNTRLSSSLQVLEDLRQRDDNFYRAMMQAEPVSVAKRYAGLDNEARYRELSRLNDASLVVNTTKKMDRIDRMLYSQIKSYDELFEMAQRQHDRINNIPAIQPIAEKDMKQMASGYGYRRDPVYGIGKFHEGLDFAANIGTKVYATGAGKVVSAGWNSGYGNCVDIDHGYNYLTRYAHLSRINVTTGQQVKRGDKIGEVGNTGKSTGPHLHYEVRYKGYPQNPINYYFLDITPDQYGELIRQAENAGHVMD